MKVGLTLGEIQRVTGRQWGRPDQPAVGPGAYAWLSADSGEMIYPGCAVNVRRRLRDESRWALTDPVSEVDRPGIPACPRLIAKLGCRAYVAATDDLEQARDLEALLGAANVHVCGMPPLGWGLAWAPRTPRSIRAWDQALNWTNGRKA